MSHFTNILKLITESEVFCVNQVDKEFPEPIVLEPYYIEFEFDLLANRGEYKGRVKIDGIDVKLKSAKYFDENDEELELSDPEKEVLFKALANKLWTDEEIEVAQDDLEPSQKWGIYL